MTARHHVLVVEFEIKPERAAAFAQAIERNARKSLALESGCHQFDVCRDPLRPTMFYLYEIYEDADAVLTHLQSPHFLEMNDLTAPWVHRKHVRRFVRSPLKTDPQPPETT